MILPRHHALPNYRFQFGEPASAPGVIFSLGYQNDDFGVAAFGGALPGSHATFNMAKGRASVGDVNLPRRLALPTTAVAGLRFDIANGRDARWGATLGAYANPAGFADSDWLVEPNRQGGLLGLEYSIDDTLSVNGGAVVGIDGRPSVDAVGVRVGIRF